MINIPVSLCVYSGDTQTTWEVSTGFNTDEAFDLLRTAYIAGIRNKNKQLTAATLFLSSLEDKNDPRLSEVVFQIFSSHNPTRMLVADIYSIPVGRLKINLENGTLKDAFSEQEINMLYADFYSSNSHGGTTQ